MKLIDRDLLLQTIEESRGKNPHEDSKIRVNHTIEHDHIAHLVLEQPTAYDVDKVVKQLENLGWVFADYYPDGTNISRESRKSIPYDRVIEIVKSGGSK